MYLFAGYSTTFLYNTVSLHCMLHNFIAKLTLHYSYDHFPCLACKWYFLQYMHCLPQNMCMHSFELKGVHSCYPTIVCAVSKLFPLVCLSGGSLVLSLQRNSLCRPSSCHFLMGCPTLLLLIGLLDYIFTKKPCQNRNINSSAIKNEVERRKKTVF